MIYHQFAPFLKKFTADAAVAGQGTGVRVRAGLATSRQNKWGRAVPPPGAQGLETRRGTCVRPPPPALLSG